MSTTVTQQQQRERVRLQAATQAVSGQADIPAAARWLAHRADCYRALAQAHHADGEPDRAALATGAAEADTERAHAIQPGQ